MFLFGYEFLFYILRFDSVMPKIVLLQIFWKAKMILLISFFTRDPKILFYVIMLFYIYVY